MPLLLSWKAQCSCTGLLKQFKQKDISIINIPFFSSNCKQEGEQAYFVVHFSFGSCFCLQDYFIIERVHEHMKRNKSGKSFWKEILDKSIPIKKKLTIWIFSGWFKDSFDALAACDSESM